MRARRLLDCAKGVRSRLVDRRNIRIREKVIHKHRIGAHTLRRVSELVFVRGKPNAILRWLDMSGDSVPLYMALDPGRLRRARGTTHMYFYDGVTIDPGFDRRHAGARPTTPGR